MNRPPLSLQAPLARASLLSCAASQAFRGWSLDGAKRAQPVPISSKRVRAPAMGAELLIERRARSLAS
jgi:hypothetical protein